MAAVDVELAAAEGGEGDLDDDVGVGLDDGDGAVFDCHLARAVEDDGFHCFRKRGGGGGGGRHGGVVSLAMLGSREEVVA